MKRKSLGLTLIAAAFIGWALFIILPFTQLPLATKATAATVSLVLAEISFLLAALILGTEYVQKFRRLGRKPKAKPNSDSEEKTE